MGIPSLKSVILYNVSLYFSTVISSTICHFFRIRFSDFVISSEQSEPRNLNHANITNIPTPIHENAHFYGQSTDFSSLSTETAIFMDRKWQLA